jgi:tetratricopeptide (TPR) repeat protein
MAFLSNRAVLLTYFRDGKRRRGSGLRIGGRLVLTADHCADGQNHLVVVDGQEFPAQVEERGSSNVDIAILSAPTMPPVPQLSCARLNTAQALTVNNCQALGFPKWKDRATGLLRGHEGQAGAGRRARWGIRRAQIEGYVPTGEGADPYAGPGSAQQLALKIMSAPRDMPPVPTDLERQDSPWQGMSGSVIVSGSNGVVIGVVCTHAPPEGASSLTFTPLAAIDNLPRETAVHFWSLMNVRDPRALPVLPHPNITAGESTYAAIGQLPAPPSSFIDRGTTALLSESLEDASPPAMCVLTGMRGAGKTHVAAAYARSRIEAGHGLVGWVNAETVNSAVIDLARIAEVVGVADPGGDTEKSARRLREHLTTWPGDSLVVFDNATDPDRLAEYLPTLGRTKVIITSTDSAFAELAQNHVTVSVFTRSESIKYLQKRTGLDDAAGADRVAEELGDLPLALSAAAAAIRQPLHRNYADYLEQLHRYPVEEVLRRPPGQDYRVSTAAALLMSVDSLEEDDDDGSATALVDVLATLSINGVRRDLLTALYSDLDKAGRARAVATAIESCLRASLLSWSITGESAVMHPLLARVLRDRAQAAGSRAAMVGSALKMLKQHFFDESRAWRKRELGQHLVEQIEALWVTGIDGVPTQIIVDAVQARSWGVRQLYAAADLSRGLVIGVQTFEESRRLLGEEDPNTLAARKNLADVLESAGHIQRATELFDQNLVVRERVLGPVHPDTMVSRNDLGHCYYSARRFVDAVKVHERTLEDRARVLGPNHPETQVSRNNLASAYGAVGRTDRGIPLLERNLADREDALGPDDPNTMVSRNSLAFAYELAGRRDEAIRLFKRNLDDRERLLGRHHPITMISRNNLGYTLERAGRPSDAIPLLEQNLADRERLLGPFHPDTMISRDNVGYAYGSAGRFDEAIPLLQRNLADHERLQGGDHPHTLMSRKALADTYVSAGQRDNAIPLLKQNIADQERVLAKDHTDTVDGRKALADIYVSDGCFDEAIALLEQNVAAQERTFGPDHPFTLEARKTLDVARQTKG